MQLGKSKFCKFHLQVIQDTSKFIFHDLLCYNLTQIAKFIRPIWGPPGSCRPQMGLMLAQWTLLSRKLRWYGVPLKYGVVWHGITYSTIVIEVYINHRTYSQKTFHISSSGASYSVSVARSSEKIDLVIMLQWQCCTLTSIIFNQMHFKVAFYLTLQYTHFSFINILIYLSHIFFIILTWCDIIFRHAQLLTVSPLVSETLFPTGNIINTI